MTLSSCRPTNIKETLRQMSHVHVQHLTVSQIQKHSIVWKFIGKKKDPYVHIEGAAASNCPSHTCDICFRQLGRNRRRTRTGPGRQKQSFSLWCICQRGWRCRWPLGPCSVLQIREKHLPGLEEKKKNCRRRNSHSLPGTWVGTYAGRHRGGRGRHWPSAPQLICWAPSSWKPSTQVKFTLPPTGTVCPEGLRELATAGLEQVASPSGRPTTDSSFSASSLNKVPQPNAGSWTTSVRAAAAIFWLFTIIYYLTISSSFSLFFELIKPMTFHQIPKISNNV